MTLKHLLSSSRSALRFSASITLLLLLAGCGNGFLFTGDHTGKDGYALKIDPVAPVVTVGHAVQLKGTSPWGGSPIWTVLPSAAGAIDANGMFKAGAAPMSGTIVAMWKEDVRYTASAKFKIVAAPIADITVTSPTFTVNGSDTASVPLQTESTYVWTIKGGTITSGQGNNQIQFTSTTPGDVQLTVVVTNAAGDSATGNKSVTVIDLPPAIQYVPPAYTIVRGKPIAPIRPISTGGTPLTWSISPGLPAGLTFDTTSGVVTGTATSLSAAQTFTVTATNGGGSATTPLTLTVVDAPPIIAYIPSTNVFTLGQAIQSLVPISTGGPVTSWSISPGLPAGLSFNTTTGIVSGTPTNLQAPVHYTVTATNSGGSATADLTLSVINQAPVFAYTPSSYTFTAGSTIAPIVPTITQGAPTTFSVNTPLPGGLALDTGTGRITGIPTVTGPATTYTVTGTNSDGTSSTATVTITVIAKPTATITASTRSPLFGASVTLTPTFAGAVSAGVGTSRGASDLSATPVSGVSLPSAPLTSAQIFWLRATDAAGDFVDDSVLVTPQPVVVGPIVPNDSSTSAGATTSFTATVTGGVTNALVWTATAGTINPTTGVFVAPNTPGQVFITATSKDDPTKSSSTNINVVSSATSAITASTLSPLYGASVTVTPTFTNAATASVGTSLGASNISISPVTGVAIPTSALTVPTTFWLRTTNAAGASVDSSVMVTPQIVAVGPISPASPTRSVSGNATFTATVTGGVTNTLTWTAGAGVIDPNTGAWTAPATAQQVLITATAKDDTTKFATTTVTVVPAGTAVLVATPSAPLFGATATLTPTFTNAVSAVIGTSRGGSDVSSTAVNGVGITTGAITSTQIYWLRTTNAAGDSTDVSTTVTPQTVAVGPISPANSTVTVSSTATFSAIATGGVTNGLTWSTTGSATGGTIDPATGVWTAPSTPGTVTIKATSKDDPTKSSTTTVTVAASATASIVAAPSTPLYGGTVVVTPTFAGATSASVGTTRGGSDLSTTPVTGQGLTTAALTVPTTFWLRAIDASGHPVDASVMVTPQTVAVGPISPAGATRSVSSSTTFTATATGGVTNTLTWTASGGTIDPNTGIWTAPGSTTPANVTITATSKDDPTKSSSTTVHVVAAGVATINASNPNPLYGATVTITATFSNVTSAAIGTSQGANDFAPAPVTGVGIATTALTAPKTYWLHTVDNGGQAADVSVTVTPQTVVVAPITPAAPSRTISSATTFSTTATGGLTNGLTWSATGGTINPNTGTWTAPATPGSVLITATSKDDTSKSASTTVTVVALPTAALAVSTTSPLYGASVALTPTFSGATSASLGTSAGASDISTTPVSGTAITSPALTAARTFWLRATDVAGDFADDSKTVTPQTVVISAITSTATKVSVGLTAGVQATVTHAVDTSINWTATGGSFAPGNSASGVNTTWTAPATAGNYILTAASAADPSKQMTYTITVVALPVAGSLTPSTTTPLFGATVTLTPVFTGGTGSVDQSIGAVTSGVAKTTAAITAATTYNLTVTNTAGQTASVASALITPQTVSVDTPTAVSAFVTKGLSQTYTSVARNAFNTAVTWSATGGSFSGSTWTAPNVTGPYTIKATSVADPTKSATTTVTVVNPPVITSFAATDPIISLNHATTLTPVFTNGAGTARIGISGTGSSELTNASQSGVGISTGPLAATTVFTLTVYNEAGNSTSATITVTAIAGSSSPTASLSGPRYAHTSTLLPDGHVLVVGGRNDTAALNTSQLYDPASQTFADAGTMTTARFGHTATLLANNTVLVTGGNSGSTTATTELWSGSFASAANLNSPREKHTATLLLDGTVLIVGGVNGSSPVVSAELYNPSTGASTYTAGNLNTARFNHTATLLANGKVLISGGNNGSVALKTAELYDPATGAFTVVGSMANARQRHAAVLLNDGTVALIGGQGTSAPLASAEIFSAATNTFSTTAGTMVSARDSLSATLIASGKVIAAGGIDGTGTPVKGSEIFDPVTGNFGLTAMLGTARAQHSATLLQNGQILITGGLAQGASTSAAELIDPQDGLTPYLPSAAMTAPVGALRGQTGLTATVPAQTHVEYVWMITGGSITAGAGTRAVTFSMPGSGTATLDVLVVSDRIVPSHMRFVVTPKPVISAFAPARSIVSVGGSTTLNWTVLDAASLSIDQGIGVVTGTSTGVTAATVGATTYTLTATNAGGSVTATTTLTAVPAPIAASLTAAANTVPVGGNTTLTPTFSQGTGVITPGIGSVLSGPAYPTAAISAPTTFTLTVTNAAGDTATKSVSIGLQPVVVTGISGPLYVTSGRTAAYTAVVTGSVNTAVNWTASAGSIDATGHLTAPAGITTPTPLTITATSVNGGTPASLTVQVVPLPMITSFTANPTTVSYGGAATVTPVFINGTGQITSLGSVSSGQAVATGPLTAQKTFTLTVTNLAGDSVTQDATVSLGTPSVTTPTPNTPVSSGDVVHFTATTQNSANPAVTWSATGGSFSGSNWTAPAAGTYTITATSVSPAGLSASTQITVVDSPLITAFTGNPLTISSGASSNLTAVFSSGTPTVNPGSTTPTSNTPFNTGALTTTTTYTLTVTNSLGKSATRSLTVNVIKGVTSGLTDMAVSRIGHTVTLMANGTVLLAGGSSSPTAETYSSVTGTLTTLSATMKAVRYYHTATLLADGRVLLAGGSDGSVSQASAELYNPATGAFTLSSGTMVQARRYHTAALMPDGRVLLSGGLDASGSPLTSAEIYNPVTDSFSAAPAMSTAREFASATVLQSGSVLLAGGDDTSTSTNSAQIFNGTAYTAATLAQARAQHTATPLSTGNTLVVGGFDTLAATALTSTELFNGTSFAGSAILPAARYGHIANLLASGELLVTGGSSDGTAPLKSSVIFDPVQGQYIPTGDMQVPRFDPASTIVRTGKVLITGGSSNPGNFLVSPLNTMEIYDPQDGLVPSLPSASLTAPANSPDNATGLTASVPTQNNVRYVWSLTNGAITSGLNTHAITFSRGTGASVLSVLVISDRQVPVQSTVTIAAAPAISSFTASPSTNTVGLPTTLAWTVNGGAGLTLSIDHGVGDVTALGGSVVTATPAATTTYTLTATDANGSTTRTVTLTAIPAPVASGLSAAANPIERGSSTTIVPTFTNGSASIDNGIGVVASGVAYPTGNLTTSTLFTLSVTNSAGAVATRTLSVNVMPVVVVAISGPANVTVGSSSANYTTAVTGAVNKSVTWSVSAGTITSGGTLTAPNTTGDIIVTATSVADPTQHNQLTVHVVAPASATSFTAATNPVLYGGSTTITPAFAQGTATIDQGIGSVTSGIAYTTGTITADKTFTLTVTNAAGNTSTTPLIIHPQTVTVGAINGPASGKVTQSRTFTFSAIVTGAVDTSLTWTATGGSFTGATWTAPSALGAYTITATAVNGVTNTLSVTVIPAPAVASFTASPIGINRNQSSTLTASFSGAGTGTNAAAIVTPGNLSIATTGGSVSTGPLTVSETYTLTVTNDAGDTATAQTSVQVFLGRFSATSNTLAAARNLPTATLDADGNVLISGGATGSTSADLFSGTSLAFSAAGPMLSGRSGHTSTLLPNGLILIAGGTTNGSTALTTAELYNPANGSFTSAGSLQQARRNHRAILLDNGKVLLLGGSGLSSAELYDSTTNTFALTGSMASVRDSASASRLPDGRILVAGGSNGSSRLASAEIFDPATNSFSTAGSMLQPRQFHTATSLTNGQVLIAGGTGNTSAGSAEIFNTSLNRFVSTGDMIQPRQEHVAALLASGMVLLAGGNSGTTSAAINQAELFDPSQGQFLKTDFMATTGSPTTGAAATILPSGQVLVTGGTTNGSSAVPGSELYTSTDGLTAAAADPSITAPTYAGQAATGVAAHVTATANARYIWTVTNGTLASGQGTPSIAFNLPATGNATLDVLVVTDRLVPSHGHAVVIGEPAPTITSFTAAANPVLYGASTSITPVFSNATAGSVIGTGAVGSADVTASAASGVAIPVGPLNAPVQYRLTLTNRAGITVNQVLTVNIDPIIVSAVSPANPIVSVNGTRTFTATVSQAVNTGIIWSATGGAINPSTGVWVAPSVAGTYTIKATAAANGTTFAATTATVVDLPAIQSFTAAPATVNFGQASSLTPVFTGAAGNKASIGTTGANSSQLTSTATTGAAVATAALTANTTYTLTVTNAAGDSTTATVQVAVIQPFSATGTMAIARSGESMTLLPDGSVLVAGGTNAADKAEIYTAATGSFALIQRMQAARRNHTATLLASGQVLLAGGSDGSGAAQNTAELFDPATGVFTATTGVMAHARQSQTAALLPDGRVLIAGGFNATENQLASAEIFDPATSSFTTVATSMTSARTQATATTLADGRILVAGGYDGSAQLATAEIFANGAFATTSLPMGSARSRHNATLLPSGQVLLSGGSSGSGQLATAVLFTAGTPDTFNGVGALAQARQDASATLLANGKVLVSGGSLSGASLASAELFNTATPTFTATGSMLAARANSASTLLLDGTVLVAGGTSDGVTPLKSAERFDLQDGVTPFQANATITPSVTHAYPQTAGLTASVPTHAGNRVVWSLRNGTITAGQGTPTVTFTMANTGDAVLDALVLSDHAIPSHGRITVVSDPLPVLTSFTASQNPVPYGGFTSLTPVFSNATGVMLGTAGSGSSDVSTSVTSGTAITVGPLAATTSYTLTFPMAGGTQIVQTLAINVLPVHLAPVSPATPTVTAGHTQAFTATVTQALNTGVAWTATGGSITSTGLWTAPATPGTYSVRATAAADGTTTQLTTVTVIAPAAIQSFVASSPSVSRGQAVTLTPVFTGGTATIGTSGAGSSDISASAASGSSVSTGALTATTTYTLTVTNTAGDTATQTAQVAVTKPFTATGTMTLAREGQTTTALADGTVLVAGGTAAADVAEIYTDGSGTFARTSAMTAARKGHTATLLANGSVLFTGGSNGSNVLASAEIYDPATKAFTAVTGTMAHARQHHAATLLADGRVLLLGGSNPTDHQLASAEIFDPATGSFTATSTSMAVTREFAIATAMPNGDVLVTGGIGTGGTTLNSGELYTGGAFSGQSFLMRSARAHHTATLMPSGQVLLAGGSDGTADLGSVEVYTGGSTNASFTTLSASMSAAREQHTATLLASGKLLLSGGYNGTSAVAAAELFDPATGTFTAAGSMVTARYGAGAVLLGDGKVLLAGGIGAGPAALASAELFDPADGLTPALPALGLTAPVSAAFATTQTAQITLPLHARCVWSVENGTLLSGAGTGTITFTTATAGDTTVRVLVYTEDDMPEVASQVVTGH